MVVLDPSLIRIQNPTADLKQHGIIVLNTDKTHAEVSKEYGLHPHRWPWWTRNKIAREVLGVPITNTTMIGALIKATGVVKWTPWRRP